MEIKTALGAFDALSQETRLAVVRQLVTAGPKGMSAGHIAEALHCRQNTMSSHLKVLALAGLVDSRRDGRSIVYSANFGTIRDLVLFLMEDCCAGNAVVCGAVAKSVNAKTKEKS
jgi:DNA-binding transcriptional ArsR family regulator